MKIYIILLIFLSYCTCYEYYKFGNSTCTKDTIWIDGFGGSKSIISGSGDISVWTGLLMWRDYINSKGGICLDEKSQTDDQCESNERRKVCVTLVELADSFTSLEKYEELIKDYIKQVSSITGFKPHFLVAPSYPELTNYTFKMVAQNNGKVTSEGINILVFSSASNDDVYTQNYKFMISPVIKLSKYPVSAVDLITNRYKVSRVLFMGDKSSSAELTTICDSFVSLLDSAKGITVMSKRCSYEDDKVDGKTCNEDSDCTTSDGKKHSCTYPKYDFSQFASINGRMNYGEKWLRYIKILNPDMVIFGSDDTVNLLKILQTTVYLPPKVMGIYKSSMWYSPNKVNSPNYNSHFLIEFDENIDFGVKDRFMGTTSQFFKYFNDNFESYRSEEDNIFPDGLDSLNNDYTLIGRGAAIGITIQKIVELCKHFSIDVSRSFQSTETFNKLITLNQDNNFKVCIDSSTKKITQPCSVSSCASGCVNWDTFYGPITFDSSGTNSAKTGVVAQIQTNSTGDKYFTLLAPNTISACNQDKKVCSSQNNYRDCTCYPVYTASWPWVPFDQEYMLRLSSAPGVVLFILALIIFLINIGIIVRVVINIRQWNPLFVPYSTGLYLLYALFLTFSSFSLFDDRTESQCLFQFFTAIITNSLLFFCPLLTILEENTRLNETSSTLSKLQGILNVLVYSIYFFITSLFVFSSGVDSYVETTVYKNGEQPFSYKYCTDSDYSYMCLVLACVSFLIHLLGIYKNRGLPSYYFRRLHYYFTGITGIYILIIILPSLHNKDSRNYYIIRVILELLCSVLYISPFVRISSLFRLRKADELYKKPNDNKAELINLFKKKLNRAFFYCFLAQENDVKCFELYEDIQTFKTKKTTVEINEMKRIIFTNHFSNPSIHANLGMTQEFIQLQRQEVDKAEGGNGFDMTENLIVNYLAQKHYFERFQLSDFYKAYKTNGTLFKMLKKHSIPTLVAIYEYTKVSIILDTTKDPEIFHQHVAFYNASIASKSSLFRSSFNSQNSARNKDVKLSIQPNKPAKKESISYLDSNNVPNSELADSIRKEADSFNDTDSATSKKRIDDNNRMLHTDSSGQVFDKSIIASRRSSTNDNNESQKTNGSELSRTEANSDQQISNSNKDSVSTPSAVPSTPSGAAAGTPKAKAVPTIKPGATAGGSANANAKKTPNNVKPTPTVKPTPSTPSKQSSTAKVKSEDKSSASQNLISPAPGSTDKSDMKTDTSSDDVA